MEISRIEAFNPNKINWRQLTAKEIMKYERQGVDVPDVYLQWAQEFLNSIAAHDNDDTTYETAKSQTRYDEGDNKPEKAFVKNNTKAIGDTSQLDVTENSDAVEQGSISKPAPDNTLNANADEDINEENENPEAPQLTKAQEKRQQMTSDGVSLRKQAIKLRKDSNNTSMAATLTAFVLKRLEDNSSREDEELNSEITKILSDATKIKKEFNNQIKNIDDGKSDNTVISKLEQYNAQLQQFGKEGQKEIAQTSSTLQGIGDSLEAETQVLFDAVDFGSVTSETGQELIQQSKNEYFIWRIIDYIIGKSAENSGNNSTERGNKGYSAQTQAINTNNSNILDASSLKLKIEDTTGVAGAKNKKKNEETEESKTDIKKDKNKNEADKDIKASNNDGTDKTDKMDISIDEILKRKIRKGEWTEG